MENKTLKVALAALMMATVGSVRPNASGDTGGVAQTKPITVNCCSTGGMTATASGKCDCKATMSDTVTAAGRARGDVVRLKGTLKGAFNMDETAKIQVPPVGIVYEYQYGYRRLVIGSFSLRDQTLNPKLDNMMKSIIAAAAKKAGNEKFNTMVWYGYKTPGGTEVIERGESLTSATDLSNITVELRPESDELFYITLPESAGGKEFKINLK